MIAKQIEDSAAYQFVFWADRGQLQFTLDLEWWCYGNITLSERNCSSRGTVIGLHDMACASFSVVEACDVFQYCLFATSEPRYEKVNA